MEQETTYESQYNIVVDILAEMVTNYLAYDERNNEQSEQRKDDKHAS